MSKKIKAIIKRPDEQYGHVTWISDNLENMQKIVGGYLEPIYLPNGTVILGNEYSKLEKEPHNFNIVYEYWISPIASTMETLGIHGTVIVCGTKGAEFVDIPITLADWKRYLTKWGN